MGGVRPFALLDGFQRRLWGLNLLTGSLQAVLMGFKLQLRPDGNQIKLI